LFNFFKILDDILFLYLYHWYKLYTEKTTGTEKILMRLHCFAAKGYDKTTMDDIVDEAGLQKAAYTVF
jgi:hypothetical protein